MTAPIREMNERTTDYVRSGLTVDAAIKQTVADYVGQLAGTGYKILSSEEIQQNNNTKFFEPYGRDGL